MLVTVAQWLVLASLVGVVVGTGASFFLHGLLFLTSRTESLPAWALMMLLPMGGLANGLLLHYGYRVNTSGLKDSMLAAVHAQGGRMPLKTVLIKPVAALITLACGGSAGKEGPCSHIGAVLGSAIARGFKLNAELSKRMVACGVSAGFASVFGTPLGGAIYGVEVLAIGRIRHDFLFPAVVAGVTAFQVSKFWGVPYEYFQIPSLPNFSEIVFLKTVLIGMICGITARVFVDLVQWVGALFLRLRQKLGIWPPLMPLLGGCLLAVLVFWIPTRYLGLSLPLMNDALAGLDMPYSGFLWKSLLVAITLGSGFYGGVVTPQFVIGAVTGNAFAHVVGISPELGAAVGLVAVVASASNTPVAAVLMGIELFGGSVGTVYIAGAAIAAYQIIGHRSVYPDQPLAYAKSYWMTVRLDQPVGQEKARLSYGLLRWWKRRKPRL